MQVLTKPQPTKKDALVTKNKNILLKESVAPMISELLALAVDLHQVRWAITGKEFHCAQAKLEYMAYQSSYISDELARHISPFKNKYPITSSIPDTLSKKELASTLTFVNTRCNYVLTLLQITKNDVSDTYVTDLLDRATNMLSSTMLSLKVYM
jgi:DNA-binding ferritin-like protein